MHDEMIPIRCREGRLTAKVLRQAGARWVRAFDNMASSPYGSAAERERVTTFVAHYRSLDSQADRARGLFEFESASRMGSKANAHDARVRMLELFGNDALSWTIEKIERKPHKESQADGHLEMDFRAPVKKKRKSKREYW